jgi:hypothetical protein
MKVKLEDEVDVKIKHDHDFDKEDVEDIIDKITESVLIIIAAATVSRMVKKWIA